MKQDGNIEILKVERLKRYFNIGKDKQGPIYVRAVDGVSFDIKAGETLGLVGESGSGKSTIAYTVVGMYSPTSGQIRFKGKNIGMKASRRSFSTKREIQIVFQDPGSSLNPKQNIEQILALPFRIHTQMTRKQILRKIIELLEKVELSMDYLYKSPASIGG